jgi:hypothetical protein
LGDANSDGLVSSTDALIILSADVGMNTSQFCPMNCGDVNGDGYVTSSDALIILSYDVGHGCAVPDRTAWMSIQRNSARGVQSMTGESQYVDIDPREQRHEVHAGQGQWRATRISSGEMPAASDPLWLQSEV